MNRKLRRHKFARPSPARAQGWVKLEPPEAGPLERMRQPLPTTPGMVEGRAMQEQLPTSPGMGEARAMQEQLPLDAAIKHTGVLSRTLVTPGLHTPYLVQQRSFCQT